MLRSVIALVGGVALAILGSASGPGAAASAQDAPTPGARSPVPDKAAREKLTAELRELFQAEYSLTGKSHRAKFARSMLEEANRTQDANLRLVMLVETRNLATDAGEMGMAFEVISRIVGKYDVRAAGPEWSATAQKIGVLGELEKEAKSRIEQGGIARSYLDVARKAMATGEYESASDAARKAGSLARRARDRDKGSEAKDLEKEISLFEQEFKGLAAAELKLSVEPDDPAANLLVGRFYAFVKGDWKNGLACLSKCSDEALKAMAAKDVGAPRESKDQEELAKAWDGQSKKETLAPIRQRCLERAGLWYGMALEGATGISRLRIKRRVEQLEKEGVAKLNPGMIGPSSAPGGNAKSNGFNLIKLIDPKRDTISGTWTHGREGLRSGGTRLDKIEIPYEPPEEYDFTLEFTFIQGAGPTLQILTAKGRLFFWKMGAFGNSGMTFGVINRKPAARSPSTGAFPLEPGKRYVSTVRVRKSGVTAEVNGRKISSWETDYSDLSDGIFALRKSSLLGLAEYDTVVDIHRVEVTDVTGKGKLLRGRR